MIIKASAEIRNNYRKVADFCKETGEPVFLTNNGEGELVVMSIEAYNRDREQMRIEAELLRIEAERAAGRAEYLTLGELDIELKNTIDEVVRKRA